MSYFPEYAKEEAKEWLEEFEQTLKGEDFQTYFSGLSQEFHDSLLKHLADKIFWLNLSYLDYI
jgi:hypothetical protein